MRLPSLSNQQRAFLAIVFSMISILVFLGRGVYLIVVSILPRTVEIEAVRVAVFEITTMATCALLMLPMLVLNLQALRGKESPTLTVPPLRLKYAIAIGAIWIVMLCLGSLVVLIPEHGWAGVVPLLPFGILLPLTLLIWTAAGGLLSTSKRRFWSILGFSIAGSTTLAIASGYLLVGIGREVGELLWGTHPFWRGLVDNLGQQLEAASTPEEALNLLIPYLSNPWVLIALMLFAAGLVPLTEEAAKAFLLLCIGPRLRSVGEGFVLGALCGAGFALVEGMLATATTFPLWGFSVTGRAASSLMHITVSALLGGAIATAFLHKRYRQLLGMYLLSSGLHGLWNGTLVVGFYLALRVMILTPQLETNDPSAVLQVMVYSFLILLVFGFLFTLSVASAVALPLINGRLRKQAQAERALIHQSETTALAEVASQRE